MYFHIVLVDTSPQAKIAFKKNLWTMCKCSVGHINAWIFYVFDFSACEMLGLLTVFHDIPELLCLDLNLILESFLTEWGDLCRSENHT